MPYLTVLSASSRERQADVLGVAQVAADPSRIWAFWLQQGGYRTWIYGDKGTEVLVRQAFGASAQLTGSIGSGRAPGELHIVVDGVTLGSGASFSQALADVTHRREEVSLARPSAATNDFTGNRSRTEMQRCNERGHEKADFPAVCAALRAAENAGTLPGFRLFAVRIVSDCRKACLIGRTSTSLLSRTKLKADKAIADQTIKSRNRHRLEGGTGK